MIIKKLHAIKSMQNINVQNQLNSITTNGIKDTLFVGTSHGRTIGQVQLSKTKILNIIILPKNVK
jgi:hypothetical protein